MRTPGLITRVLGGDYSHLWSPVEYGGRRRSKPKAKPKPKDKDKDKGDGPNCKKSKLCDVGGKKYCIPHGRVCGGKKRARLDPRRVEDLRKKAGTFEGAIGGLKNGLKFKVTADMLIEANKLGVSQRQLMAGRVPLSVQSQLRRKFNQMTIGTSVVKPERGNSSTRQSKAKAKMYEEIDKLIDKLSDDDKIEVDDIRESLVRDWNRAQVSNKDIEELANQGGKSPGSIAAMQIMTTDEYQASASREKEYDRKSEEESRKRKKRDAQLEATQPPPLTSMDWQDLHDGVDRDFLSMPKKEQEQVIKKYSAALDRIAEGIEWKQESVRKLGPNGWKAGYLNELFEVPGSTFGDFAVTRKSPYSQALQVQTRDGKNLFSAKDTKEATRIVAALSLAKPLFFEREGKAGQSDDGRYLVANEREMTEQSYQRIRRLTDALLNSKAGIDLEAYKLVTGEDYTGS